jgi:hypothetical protein
VSLCPCAFFVVFDEADTASEDVAEDSEEAESVEGRVGVLAVFRLVYLDKTHSVKEVRRLGESS